MSSQPSSSINTSTSFTIAPTPKTPSSSTTASPSARRVMFRTTSTASNNSLDTLSPSSPFTPFSARSGLSRLSSAFNTPLQLDDSPTATTSKRAAGNAAASSKADFSDNWRTKASPSTGENAFVSNDRRLPRALAASHASPSTSALASPKHRMSATTTTTPGLASPIKYFSASSSATNPSPTASRRRVPLFDRSNLEALTAMADAAGTKNVLSEHEDDIVEEDASHTSTAAANVHHSNHNPHHLNSSSDSDFFIRMDVQPRTLFRDYLSTATSASLSALRDDGVGEFDLEEEDEKGVEAAVKANYCSGCGSSSSSNASANTSSSITLSYLQPCQHAICHQCFTGMLNIVGEKGLECPMCKGQVTSFDVQVDSHHQPSSSLPTPTTPARLASAYHSSERNAITTAAGATTKMKTTTGQALTTTTTFASVLSAKKKMKAAGPATADDVF
ncbi:hypothetical protein FRC00_005550, partial [Tulasnella sp. 408]